jgi:hypothetical protein
MKIRPVGDELFHVDRRTDTAKLAGTFRSFAKTPYDGTIFLTSLFINERMQQNSLDKDRDVGCFVIGG